MRFFGCSAVWFTIVNLVHNFVNLVHNPVNLVHNFYKILKKSSQKHPMTFIRENLVSRKMHALRAVIWRNLRVLLVRRKLSNCEPGSQNCEPGSQFRIVNQTALHPTSKEKITMAHPDPERRKLWFIPGPPTVWEPKREAGCIPGREYLKRKAFQYRRTAMKAYGRSTGRPRTHPATLEHKF